jgi:hypothetical protein
MQQTNNMKQDVKNFADIIAQLAAQRTAADKNDFEQRKKDLSEMMQRGMKVLAPIRDVVDQAAKHFDGQMIVDRFCEPSSMLKTGVNFSFNPKEYHTALDDKRVTVEFKNERVFVITQGRFTGSWNKRQVVVETSEDEVVSVVLPVIIDLLADAVRPRDVILNN